MTSNELKQWRQQNGYSQSQLAKALGVIVITISRWEREEGKIPPFLHLALKSLPKKGGEIRAGRPKATQKETQRERKVKG
jgi:transcriptional regulator with XRE-family HTH domain